jgi:cytidine deaminase
MQIRNINLEIEEYNNEGSLPKADLELLKHATTAIDGSYAPYSEFHVGAAALLDNGQLITGSNQENAAYPSGLCAERVALFHAKSQYPDAKVKTLAITARADHFEIDHPITPCGACRQVIAEVQNRQDEKIRLIMKGESGKVQAVNGIENLLPLMFREEKLKRSQSNR